MISEKKTEPEVYSAAAAVERARPPGPAPRINGPAVFGVRPGRPILYAIAATGERPLRFSAENLPAGVALDSATGALKGVITARGSYPIELRATNSHGSATRTLRLEVGDRHTLTPPMGWNSWNCWGGAVSAEKILEAARAFVDLGLQQHGWSYINIDDGWQGVRGGENLAIQPNKKFPDMEGLGRCIHELGLRFGIYSTPWVGTYEGHIGSYAYTAEGKYPWVNEKNHNEFMRIGRSGERDEWDRLRRTNWKHGEHSFVKADVAQWDAWGVDFLKYDWKPNDVGHTGEIAEHLRAADRDIVLSLSNKAPFLQAGDWVKYANCWRTTADIQDTWESVATIGFNQDRWSAHSGPGHWNDPDMLVIGRVGWGPTVRPTRLTREEQCTHIGLWCLLSAPLLIGCDLSNLDEFTRRLLTNDEVIAIDQDSLGAQAVRVGGDVKTITMAKPLADGSIAAGLFNLSDAPTVVTLDWDDLHIEGPRLIRDLWSRTTEGLAESVRATLPPHGMKLVRLMDPATANV